MSYRILGEPYKRDIPYRPVGIVCGPRTIIGEWGRTYGRNSAWERAPKNAQLYARWRDVQPMVQEGKAEAYRWKNHGIVSVQVYDGPRISIIRSEGFWRQNREQQLATLVEFAEWLRGFGTQPFTLSGSARSLWRMTLRRQVFESGNRISSDVHLGGRQSMSRPDIYPNVVLWDIRSAYAYTLGTLWLPLRWKHYDGPGWNENVPHGYARAVVRVPSTLQWGPLPIFQRPMRTFRLTPGGGTSFLSFPTNETIMGVWSHDELFGAIAAGCDVEILEYWIGSKAQPVFEEWWQIIRNGIDVLSPEAARLLKMAANSLWGSFVAKGYMYRIWYENGWKHKEKITHKVLPKSYGLAGLVAGKVRSRLYREALLPWDFVAIAAHTDGVWLPEGPTLEPNGGSPGRWRPKESGTLHLADPQHYMIVTNGKETLRMAGMPEGREREGYWNRHYEQWLEAWQPDANMRQ